MKICLITHGRVNPDGENGITRTVYNLNKYLNAYNIKTDIFSFNDATKTEEDFIRDEFTTVKLFPRTNFFKKNELKEFIESDKFDYDLVHFHLMWMIDKNTILDSLKKKKTPYILTVHGAYAPNLIDTLKKKISMKTFEGKYIKNANSLHALCSEELVYLKNLGLKMPIKVIANGIGDVEIEKINNSKDLPNPFDSNYINILWVGRIRPDKNVLGIAKSLLYMDEKIREKIKIHIVGNGIESYISEIHKFVEKYDLGKYIIFHGPKFKEEKYQYILNCDIYLQPSYSEGISFSILDAMVCGKPMILSRQTNMTYFYNENFYLMTEPYPETIADAVQELVSKETLRTLLGNNAKKLTKTKFNWQNLIHDYIELYKSVLGK